jgi:hypothetical protein
LSGTSAREPATRRLSPPAGLPASVLTSAAEQKNIWQAESGLARCYDNRYAATVIP